MASRLRFLLINHLGELAKGACREPDISPGLGRKGLRLTNDEGSEEYDYWRDCLDGDRNDPTKEKN